MNVHELLEIAAPALGHRVLISDREGALTAEQLLTGSTRVGVWLAAQPAERLVLVDVNSRAVPLALYGASYAGIPFAPLNYRLDDDRLRALVARTAPAVVVVGEGVSDRIGRIEGIITITRQQLLDVAGDESAAQVAASNDGEASEIAVLLFTSGTTGEPKAAILSHENLSSYVLSTVEFASADADDAAVVSVPPYHIAGVSAVLTSVFAGRRIVYMEAFEPAEWVATVADQQVTHAMVVPTMLGRVLDEIDQQQVSLADLRALSYGGGPMPRAVIERALRLLPHVNFVNAYGLTETASTISVLGPDDHRLALHSDDPAIQRRLSSVGQALPTVELSIRDGDGQPVAANERGEVWVRGEQVSGRYIGAGGLDDGWFRTRDSGEFDDHGYLYLHGRLDDVIVRGGENLSPGEIEAVLIAHPAVESCAVVGIPDTEWGERVVAAVVVHSGSTTDEDSLRSYVRDRLRSARTPERIQFYTELPINETGKLLRRVLRDELAEAFATE